MFFMMTDFLALPMGCSPLEPSAGLKEPCTLRKKSFLRSFFIDTCRPGGNPLFFPLAPESLKKTVNVSYTAKNYCQKDS